MIPIERRTKALIDDAKKSRIKNEEISFENSPLCYSQTQHEFDRNLGREKSKMLIKEPTIPSAKIVE